MRQTYRNVPAVANCCENTPPGFIVPDSHIPVVLDVVCGALPLFSQRTTSPTCTVRLAGLKLKSRMLTVYSAASAVLVVVEASKAMVNAVIRTAGTRAARYQRLDISPPPFESRSSLARSFELA